MEARLARELRPADAGIPEEAEERLAKPAGPEPPDSRENSERSCLIANWALFRLHSTSTRPRKKNRGESAIKVHCIMLASEEDPLPCFDRISKISQPMS